MNGFRFLILLGLLFSCVGCASISQRQNAAVSKGVYAESAAIKAGRFDLAEKYSEQVTKLVPPPKHPISVHPFTNQGKTFVILPPAFKAAPTLAEGSPGCNEAVSQSKPLQRALNTDRKALNTFSKVTDSIVRAKDEEAAKYEEQKPSLWKRVLGWVFKLSVPLLLIGIVCLCIFFPPAVPFCIATVRFLFHILKVFLKAIVAAIETLEAKLEKKTPPDG